MLYLFKSKKNVISLLFLDPSLMFQASLSNGRLLLRVAQPSVTALLESNRPIVALATLMYAPGTLSQVRNESY